MFFCLYYFPIYDDSPLFPANDGRIYFATKNQTYNRIFWDAASVRVCRPTMYACGIRVDLNAGVSLRRVDG